MTKIKTDVWLLNTPAAPAEPTFRHYRSQSAPPPVPARLLLPGGVCPVPEEVRWGFLWSSTGQAVAVLLGGVPIGFLQAGRKPGRARFIAAGGEAWAMPWDGTAFELLFQ